MFPISHPISEKDIIAALGATEAFIMAQILQTRVSVSEFFYALERVRSSDNARPRTNHLPGRVRRLIDLLLVVLEPSVAAPRQARA